jgi:hypothetical protein
MNPTLETVLGIVGTAAAGAIAVALVPLGTILAGLLKFLALWLITRMSVHSVEQKAKVQAKLNHPYSDEERANMAAANVATITKWCGLADAATVTPIANEAHVFGLPDSKPTPPTNTSVTLSYPVGSSIGSQPTGTDGAPKYPYATGGEPKG